MRCNEGLKLASVESSGGNSEAKLEFLLLRSSAYSGLGTWITSQSSSRSEMQPFYGQDPSFYALKAKEVLQPEDNAFAFLSSLFRSFHFDGR